MPSNQNSAARLYKPVFSTMFDVGKSVSTFNPDILVNASAFLKKESERNTSFDRVLPRPDEINARFGPKPPPLKLGIKINEKKMNETVVWVRNTSKKAWGATKFALKKIKEEFIKTKNSNLPFSLFEINPLSTDGIGQTDQLINKAGKPIASNGQLTAALNENTTPSTFTKGKSLESSFYKDEKGKDTVGIDALPFVFYDISPHQKKTFGKVLTVKGNTSATITIFGSKQDRTQDKEVFILQKRQWADLYTQLKKPEKLALKDPVDLYKATDKTFKSGPKDLNKKEWSSVQWLMARGADLYTNQFDIYIVSHDKHTPGFNLPNLPNPKLTNYQNTTLQPWDPQCFAIRTAEITFPLATVETVQFAYLQRMVDKVVNKVNKDHWASLTTTLDQNLYQLEFVEKLSGRSSFYESVDHMRDSLTGEKPAPQILTPLSGAQWINSVTKKKNVSLDLVVSISCFAPYQVQVGEKILQHTGQIRKLVFEQVKFLGTNNNLSFGQTKAEGGKITVDFIFARSYLKEI